MYSSNYAVTYSSNLTPQASNELVAVFGAFAAIIFILSIILCVIMLIANYKIFKKAGEAGWKSFIPVYNLYILNKILFGNGWLFLISLIPFVNIVYFLIIPFQLAKVFGKGILFGLGLWLLNPVFLLILAFGKSEYKGY